MIDTLRSNIAKRLVNGPLWIRSLQSVKPAVDAMIAVGHLTLVVPVNGHGRNMVGLTGKGAAHYKLTVEPGCVFEPEIKSTRYKPTTVEREKHKEIIAENVAHGRSVKSCAVELGMSESYCGNLWREIVADMGWQAK